MKKVLWVCGNAENVTPDHPFYSQATFGPCESCARPLVWRSNAIPGSTKLCLGCAAVVHNLQSQSGDVPKVVSRPEDVKDFDALYGRGASALAMAMAMEVLSGETKEGN